MSKEERRRNKLIAKFMGQTTRKVGERVYALNYEELQYHTSWDWLMPVVKKIEKVWWTDFEEIDETYLAEQKIKLLSSPIHSPIKMIWEYCIQFIQWYNEHLKSKP